MLFLKDSRPKAIKRLKHNTFIKPSGLAFYLGFLGPLGPDRQQFFRIGPSVHHTPQQSGDHPLEGLSSATHGSICLCCSWSYSTGHASAKVTMQHLKDRLHFKCNFDAVKKLELLATQLRLGIHEFLEIQKLHQIHHSRH